MGLAAFITSVILTALVSKWARKTGFVDEPGHRKIHSRPVALGGGIVIFWVTMLPMITAVVLAALWQRTGVPEFIPPVISRHIPGLSSRLIMMIHLIGAAATLHILGLVDDRRHLGPMSKFFIQFAVATILVTRGEIRFQFFITNTFWATLLSILWMVVIVNAFNFLDNMDGLSAGMAIICAGMILDAALASGQVFVSAMLVLLIGALAGFLIFNFHPARIFMGDAGSLVVGLIIAVATIQTTYYRENADGAWYNTLMPLIVLAVPLYDFASVTLLRLRQGKSPFVGDTQHFSHRLVKRGMTTRQAVLTIYLATACTGLGATILQQLSSWAVLVVFTQTVMVLLIIAILERPGKTPPTGDNHSE